MKIRREGCKRESEREIGKQGRTHQIAKMQKLEDEPREEEKRRRGGEEEKRRGGEEERRRGGEEEN